jgi:putative FmdB family regulatory protein
MPIYEYHCDDCGKEFEKLLRRAADSAEVRCPSCGENHLSLKLSTFAARSGGTHGQEAPMCPSGGICPTPGLCGKN